MPSVAQTIEELYKAQARKLVSNLSRKVGLQHLELAEDAVQEAFLRGLKTWTDTSLPDNPLAWIYRVSYRLALDQIRQDRNASLEELVDMPEDTTKLVLFEDSELEAMFICCHPSLTAASQVALTLRTVCGWSVSQVADAFFSEYDSMEKRLTRARDRVRKEYQSDLPPSEIDRRLPAVLHCLYLLFSEGYFSARNGPTLHMQLASEAFRLAVLLQRHPHVQLSGSVAALNALFCLQASRFPARLGSGFIELGRQDRGLWDQGLIAQGFKHLADSAIGESVSQYHLEAAIASVHARAQSLAATDWKAIVALYDTLVVQYPSPNAKLARAIALAYGYGPSTAQPELAALKGHVPEHSRLLAEAEVERMEGNDLKAQELARLADQYLSGTEIKSYLRKKWGFQEDV